LHLHVWPQNLLRRTGCPRLILLILVMLFAACGTAPAAYVTRPTPSPTATPIATQQVMFITTDGVTLWGTLYGQGTRAIILSNEGDNDVYTWVPIAQRLAAQGYLVLGYSYRRQVSTANGLASQAFTDLRAAVAFMRSRAVAGITLMGSSLGGMVSVKEATVEKFDALVSISALVAYQDVQISDAALEQITAPKLFVTSDLNDPFTSDTYHMFEVTPQPKEEQVYSGRSHGLALFQATTGPDLMTVLLSFLQRYVPVN